MIIRKTVTLVEEINSEYGVPASPPPRRVASAAVFENPLAARAAGGYQRGRAAFLNDI